jgi:anthranilate phosphoribosyltransferase
VVSANAALALFAGKKFNSLDESVGVAREMILSGKVLQTFKKFLELNKNGS